MIPNKNYSAHSAGVIKDCLIITLVFVSLYFIDIQLTLLASLVCTVTLLTRRIILTYNPGFAKGHHVQINGEEVTIPKGIDIFNLSKSQSLETLYRYTEVVRGIMAPPEIMIIRFDEIFYMGQSELSILSKTIDHLKNAKISIIFSGINEEVRDQLRGTEILKVVGEENIFRCIKDAVTHAKGMVLRRRSRSN
ncbi:MAG: STAS domain-containing protein [Chitinophagales bacterium]